MHPDRRVKAGKGDVCAHEIANLEYARNQVKLSACDFPRIGDHNNLQPDPAETSLCYFIGLSDRFPELLKLVWSPSCEGLRGHFDALVLRRTGGRRIIRLED